MNLIFELTFTSQIKTIFHYILTCRGKLLILGVSGLLVFGGVGVGLGLYYGLSPSSNYVRQGAVVTNGYECAAIGSSILKKNGSAVDAAIASLFCEGIAMPQSMGLGGGFLMTIYIKEKRIVDTLDARETAPLKAFKDMFDGNASLARAGGLSVAVPGELKGYWFAHQKYGKLPWSELVEPTINLCINGHLITPFLEYLLKKQEQQILNSPTLREIYIDPNTNETYKQGHLLKRLQLGETLKLIAQKGADVLYNGELTKRFVDDIKNLNGIITEEDMKSYEPKWNTPLSATFQDDQTMYTSPLPGSGVILTFILNILNTFLDTTDLHTVQNWQRITESFKYGYGKRTELGDPEFVPEVKDLVAKLTSTSYAAEIRSGIYDNKTFNDAEHYGANYSIVEDHGTAHVSVLAPNGDAVSVTSTINLYFGAGIRSPSTGIILNDEMDDFSAPNITNGFDLPPSPANYIAPKKRPLSSMCPTIVVDKNGDVLLVIGAAGGTKITTTIALVMIRNLWFNESLVYSVNASRIHHQLFPMHISHEENFNQTIINGLSEIGHKVPNPSATDGFAALIAISRKNGKIEASFDRRRGGQIEYI